MSPIVGQRSVGARRLWHGSLVALALILGAMPAVQAQVSPHLKMGNPSQASDDGQDKNNFLMSKEYFALSYNNQNGTPNWVSWRLSKDDLGKAPRKPFQPDQDLPGGFKKVIPTDYNGSGFDRGHMCPHSDRSRNTQSSTATFVMTNMVPQSPENNQKAWNQLEIYLRDLVKDEGKVCYVIAGPYGKGGVGRSGFKTATRNGKVVVPSHTWKVVMVLDEDVDDPSQLDEHSEIRLIGVVVPNDRRVGLEWDGFRVPVREIEEMTGLKFFDKVSPGLIDDLKDQTDEIPIPPPSR